MQRRPLTRIELSWDDIENYEKFMKSKTAASLRNAQVADQGHEQATPSQPIRKSNRRRLDFLHLFKVLRSSTYSTANELSSLIDGFALSALWIAFLRLL
ncbi:unnamed protein product [Dibothriocephalus latus]|uniref:Uncharacterized protein n=1 Tax=Dibothriocephalus latus TaxID=60516 RepID=A0A3P7MR27_DIBLA|nr:unnamed protein product [Dibothriocephalus latus]